MECPLTGSKIPLAISIIAVLIAVLTFVYFYNELYKIKKDISEVKIVKNELNHIGNRINLVDTCIDELTNKCKSCNVTKETLEQEALEQQQPVEEDNVEYIIEEIEVSDDDDMSETELN